MNTKLTITFATLKNDYTWEPRVHVVEVLDVFTQNERQTRETAALYANDNEAVFSVKKEKGGPEIFFKAAKDFSVTFTTYEDDEETFFYSKGESLFHYFCPICGPKGYNVKGDKVLAYRERLNETNFYSTYVPKDCFKAFIRDENDNEVAVPLPF